jgi:predicted nucleic acid-binding protein
VTVVLDAGVAFAYYDARDHRHIDAAEWVLRIDDELAMTPMIVAELDYLVSKRGGAAASERFWSDLEAGAYTVRWWADALRESLGIARRHPFLGLADASLVALAGLLRTDRIATFDEHFRSVTTQNGEGFVLLPDDA